jgi:hypothetical protein
MNRARLIFLLCWLCVIVFFLGACARHGGGGWSWHDGF